MFIRWVLHCLSERSDIFDFLHQVRYLLISVSDEAIIAKIASPFNCLGNQAFGLLINVHYFYFISFKG